MEKNKINIEKLLNISEGNLKLYFHHIIRENYEKTKNFLDMYELCLNYTLELLEIDNSEEFQILFHHNFYNYIYMVIDTLNFVYSTNTNIIEVIPNIQFKLINDDIYNIISVNYNQFTVECIKSNQLIELSIFILPLEIIEQLYFETL